MGVLVLICVSFFLFVLIFLVLICASGFGICLLNVFRSRLPFSAQSFIFNQVRMVCMLNGFEMHTDSEMYFLNRFHWFPIRAFDLLGATNIQMIFQK